MMLQSRGEKRRGKWLWRCHIDLTEGREDVWQFLRPFVEIYDGLIFTMEDYVKDDLNAARIFILPPAIDPLSAKNLGASPGVNYPGFIALWGEPESPPHCSGISL